MSTDAMSRENIMHVFQSPTPAKLRVEIPRGRISLTAEATDVVRIELTAPRGDAAALEWIAEAEVAQVGDEIVVRGRKLGLMRLGFMGPIEATVHAPLESAPSLSLGAGRIETTGKLGKVFAASGAGAVKIEACEEARVRTGSGDVSIAACAGSVDAKTGAGQIAIGKVGADARIVTGAGGARLAEVRGAANLTTGHGNIEIGQVGDSVEAFTASGNVEVRHADHGRVRARTVSGQVSVGVARGVAALLDVSTMSGRVRSELEASAEPGADEARVELVLSTVSGNVNVARA